MTVRQRLNDRGRVIRAVDVVTGTPVIDSTVGDWQPFNAVTPRIPVLGLTQNPRTVAAAWGLEWADGYRDPGSLGPGYRMELSTGPVLEVLGSPEALKEGERITGWAALAQDITSLYPFEGEIRTAGDDDEQPLIVAIWEFREDQERQGRYERFRGRVPIEFQSMARVNHELIVDEIVYKIQEGITNLETMTIDLVVSKHHG